ncbi:hypothetical protein [Mesonia mobilis]|uniref:hypothetical protein n=1 Tax=Mesonia mobilis TaxID=369791 RepID=UPI0026E95CFC|nr:hypothetical protein [Mesonia mobilis]
MLGRTFSYKNVGSSNETDVKTDLYTFKCNFNQHYIIEVENHAYNIFIIKFFKKNHKLSKRRYSLVNSKSFLRRNKTNGSKNFLMVLNTVMKIILDTYQVNRYSCFGFIGAPTKRELDSENNEENINEDGTVANTKRFNIYGLYVKRYFSPSDFEHIELPTSSGYLIKSKENIHLTTPLIEEFFKNYINLHC